MKLAIRGKSYCNMLILGNIYTDNHIFYFTMTEFTLIITHGGNPPCLWGDLISTPDFKTLDLEYFNQAL